MSFLEAPATDFLPAWRGSIERAEQESVVGGIMVSEHFCRIGRMRPQSSPAGGDMLIARFMEEEAERQRRLMRKQSREVGEVQVLVDVLQFCDLLSLYLCCGSPASIEFPQKFRGQTIRLRREDQLCRTEPAIFGDGTSLAVLARKFSDFRLSQSIPVLLT